MNWEKYIKMVIRNIKCSGKKKKEIKRELTSDITTALAAGEEWQSIMERMGTPAALAAEFNENMPAGEGHKYKRGIAVWILTGVVLGMAILLGAGYLLMPKTCVLAESEYFDEEEVRAQTEEIITLLDQNDMETLSDKFATEKMKSVMKQETIDAARAQVGADWGAFESFSSEYLTEVRQLGTRYAVAQIVVEYENRSVTYTISLDKDMKLAGLYMK